MASSLNEFDYVIVGGGTSGLVIASRLSENPDLQVLVIEAGEDHVNDPRVSMPAGWPALLGSDCDWNFGTIPQNGLGGRIIAQPQGRILGGSGAINAQAFIAPSKAGIDTWESLGNPGWGWKAMSPYYQKFHTLSTPPNSTHEHLGLDYVDQKIHGYRGPIQASFAGTPQDALSNAWYKTFQSLGYEGKGDPFSGEFVGGYNSPATIDPVSKERSYSAVAYYQPIKNRSNLTLLTGALVDKIELEATERTGLFTATAVRLIHNGETKIVRAHKEVIVAAGTFNSPKLLELSGIGSATLLRSHDIPLLIDSPGVGENLQDHLMTGFSFEVNNGVNTIDDLARKDPVAIQMALQQYMESKSGPFTAAGVNSMAFMPLVNPLSDDNMEATKICLDKNIADAKSSIHYDFIRSILENANEGSASFFTYPAGGNFEIGGGFDVENATKAVLDGNYITIGVCLLHPLSRGSVHIGSGDPAQKPKIDPKYLTQELDVEVFARHVQSLRKLVKTQPLASLLKVDGRRNSPDVDLTDLEAVKQYARSTAISNWHPVGTCAMMPREKGGVVDEKLLVHGTANLRVVDASIFPMITRGNPLTSVYAVAEKAADLIKKGDDS